MAALSISEAALGAIGGLRLMRKPKPTGAPNPTGAPVRRDSIEAGTFEQVFFVRPEKGETDRLVKVAKRLLDAARQTRREARAEGRALSSAERRLCLMTAAAVRLFEELATLARINAGRVFPTYDYLADKTGLARGTIARTLKALQEVGLILSQRRCVRVEAEGPGPRFKQTSNAYRLLMPSTLVRFLPRWMRPAPIPVDTEQREAERRDEGAAMLASLSCKELAEATLSGPLAKIMAKLGASIDQRERESQNESQPLLELYHSRADGVGLVGQHV